MTSRELTVGDRVALLERTVRRMRLAAALVALGLGAVAALGLVAGPHVVHDELRTRRLVLEDDGGRVRAVLGQDPRPTQRRSREAGLTLFDSTGAERGGFGTMDDGSVVLGMDAPRGVGSPMRDRIGLLVSPNGAAYVMLIDNSTRAVAKLQSDGAGGGGVQVFKWDSTGRWVRVKTVTYDGDVRDSIPLTK